MQNRFCLCGHQITVIYSTCRGQWKPSFCANTATSQQKLSRIVTCPNCGEPLHINTLR